MDPSENGCCLCTLFAEKRKSKHVEKVASKSNNFADPPETGTLAVTRANAESGSHVRFLCICVANSSFVLLSFNFP